ncbi:MAG: helix-turn-helix domain-containing protein [Singulisphaera sp.]|nr:helix-turn-helix domain-containing protein [Mycolicibacterium sp.]MBV8610731.1 helix-turn-helix domain-containing protein [Singulisphaera sp.]
MVQTRRPARGQTAGRPLRRFSVPLLLTGLEAARARGRKGGRPKRLNAQQRALALELYTQRKHTVEEICRTLGISKPTLYAYVRGASSRSKP